MLPSRSNLTLLCKAALSAAVLGFLAIYSDRDLVLESLQAADWRWVAAAVSLGCAIVLVNGVRWSRISASVSAPLPRRFSILTYAEALFFAMITPAAVGGDVLRVTRATRAFGGLRKHMASVLLDRAVNLVSIVLLAALALPFTPIEAPGIKTAVPALLLLVLVLAALPTLALATLNRRRIRRWPLVREGLRLAILFRRFLGNARGFVETSCLSALVILLAMGTMLAAGRAVGVADFGLVQAAAAFSLALLVATLPISFAGLGPREGVMIWTLMEFGIDAGQAYSIAILFTCAFFASALPGLAIWLSGVNRLGRRPHPAWNHPAPDPAPRGPQGGP